MKKAGFKDSKALEKSSAKFMSFFQVGAVCCPACVLAVCSRGLVCASFHLVQVLPPGGSGSMHDTIHEWRIEHAVPAEALLA